MVFLSIATVEIICKVPYLWLHVAWCEVHVYYLTLQTRMQRRIFLVVFDVNNRNEETNFTFSNLHTSLFVSPNLFTLMASENRIQLKGCRIPIIIAMATVVNRQQSSQSYQLINFVLITLTRS